LGLRICTRAPIDAPQRLDAELVELLSGLNQEETPLRCAVHLNRVEELEGASGEALQRLAAAGLRVLTQTVLLRGVNDRVEALADLFRRVLDRGLEPYYLFQMDLAPGTASYRVPLLEGLRLYEELGKALREERQHRPQILPAYAVDGPGGGGKIRLCREVISGPFETEKGRVYRLRSPDGRLWDYPVN
jgi:lysine 2,3-aminomutase